MPKQAPSFYWKALITALLGLFCVCDQSARAQFTTVNAQGFAEKPVLELKGPWDFFWAEWIEPGDERSADRQQLAGRSWTPGPTSTFKKGQGYATYRLELQNIQPLDQGYSLAIRSASTAMKLMVYPKGHPEKLHVATAGQLGTSEDTEIPQLRLRTVRFFPEPGESTWIVLVQVSNFQYMRGGLWNTPMLGVGNTAEDRMNRDREFLLFCIGMIMVIGVYNIVLFARRSADKATLMLAVFCVVVCVRSLVTDNLIAWYFPQLNPQLYHVKYLLEYITMVVGPLTCVSFVHFSFIQSSLIRCYRLVINLSLLAGLAIALLNTYQRSVIIVVFQVVTLTVVMFGLVVLVRAVIHKREESRLSAAGGFMLAACVLYDVLITFDIFPQPYITSLGMSAFVFMQSQVVANRFAKAFGIAEHLSRSLKEEVERQTLELRSIMENIPQGVFIMLADQTIQGNYSMQLEQILGLQDLTRTKALPALFRNASLTNEDLSIVDSILVSSFQEPILAWELNAHSLPHEFSRNDTDGSEQILEVEWHPIVNRHGVVDRVLVTVRNVTEFRSLQASQRKDQQAFALLLEIVQVTPVRFRDFVQQSWEILRQAEKDSLDQSMESALRLRKILIRLHTWKGISRSLGLKNLAARIHEEEDCLIHLEGNDPHATEVLHERVQELMDNLRAYESIEKERLGRSEDGPLSNESSMETKRLLRAWYRYHYQPLEAYHQGLHEALESYVRASPGMTAEELIHSVYHELPGLALDLQKPVPIVESRGALQEFLPESLHRSLSYVLQHLIRNSMDHGLEHVAERKHKGKDEQGRIIIDFAVHDGYLTMEYSDDGRGLDLELVLKKAREQGLVPADESPKPRDIAELIFAPGFSTKEHINTISGRGIGMDAVRLLVEETGGAIALVLDQESMQLQAFRLRARWSLETMVERVA